MSLVNSAVLGGGGGGNKNQHVICIFQQVELMHCLAAKPSKAQGCMTWHPARTPELPGGTLPAKVHGVRPRAAERGDNTKLVYFEHPHPTEYSRVGHSRDSLGKL